MSLKSSVNWPTLRPNFNPSKIIKKLERLFLISFSSRVVNYLVFNPVQSAYRPHHPTETTLLHTANHISKSPNALHFFGPQCRVLHHWPCWAHDQIGWIFSVPRQCITVATLLSQQSNTGSPKRSVLTISNSPHIWSPTRISPWTNIIFYIHFSSW